MKPVPTVTIDGPSGSGKGTIARRVAEALGFHLLDSGALYRLVALKALRNGVDPTDSRGLAREARQMDVQFTSVTGEDDGIRLEGEEVSAELRTEDCGALASRIASIPAVRRALRTRQRDFRRSPGLVADGRDMGTAIFPDAAVKIFLTASPDERAMRRYKQLKGKGIDVSLPALSRDIAERDRRDAERSVAPLVPAEDAVVIDSTALSIEEVTEEVLRVVGEKLAAEGKKRTGRTG